MSLLLPTYQTVCTELNGMYLAKLTQLSGRSTYCQFTVVVSIERSLPLYTNRQMCE